MHSTLLRNCSSKYVTVIVEWSTKGRRSENSVHVEQAAKFSAVSHSGLTVDRRERFEVRLVIFEPSAGDHHMRLADCLGFISPPGVREGGCRRRYGDGIGHLVSDSRGTDRIELDARSGGSREGPWHPCALRQH